MIQNSNMNIAANYGQKLHKPLQVTSKKYKLFRHCDKSFNIFHSLSWLIKSIRKKY